MERNRHLFLSYSSAEAEFALKLAADLKNKEIDLWIDRLDIEVGDDWIGSLEAAIDACEAVVAILSPEYVRSKYCRRELRRADDLGRSIFPILLRKLERREWPLEIQERQAADFTDWRDEEQYRRRLDDLVRSLRTRFEDRVVTPSQSPEARYLTSLMADLESRKGVLEYVGLSGRATGSDALYRARPIEDQWSAGFSLLLESPPRAGEPEPSSPVAPVEQIVALHPRLVLLGAPGAGKTTTLRHLALAQVRARKRDPSDSMLPLLVHLADWNDSSAPLDFLRRHWPLGDDLEGRLVRGEIALFLDGLNEMGFAGPVKVRSLRKWLESPRSPARVLVSCRIADYESLPDVGLPAAVIHELDDRRIREFASRYLGDRAPGFLDAIFSLPGRTDTRLADLARNPYLLAALIFIYDQSPQRSLPRNSLGLFDRLARALWERERQRGAQGWISYERMQKAFSRLASAIHADEEAFSVPVKYAVRHLGSRSLLHLGVAASFLEVGQEVHFSHQLMLEYFAGLGLSESRFKRLLTPPQWDARVNRYWRKAGPWDHLLVAYASVAREPQAVLEMIASVDPDLAKLCVRSGVLAGEGMVSGLRKAYRKGGRIGERALAVLCELRDREAVPTLLSLLATPHERGLQVGAMAALGKIRDRSAVPALCRMGGETGAISALGEIGDPACVPTLLAALRDDRTRQHAEWALEKIGQPAIPGLLALLREGDPSIVQRALRVLGKVGEPEHVPAVEPFLSDACGNLRRAAVYSLSDLRRRHKTGAWFAAYPTCFSLLVGLLFDAERELNRTVAEVFDLLCHGLEEGCFSTLRDRVPVHELETLIRLAPDADPFRAKAAAEALRGLGWRPGGSEQHLQFAIARQDWDECVSLGSMAVPQLLRCLTAWGVRAGAAEALGKIGDPRALPKLVELREADVLKGFGRLAVPALVAGLGNEDPEVRRTAAQVLGEIGDPAAENALGKLLQDEYQIEYWDVFGEEREVDYPVREAAQEALWKIRHPDR